MCDVPCITLMRSPATHPEPSGTPRNFHWKSFSNIRSGRLAYWLFLRCCGTSREPGGLFGSADRGRVQKTLPKRLNLNQTRFNPITRISFFSGEKSTLLPFPPPRSTGVNPSIPTMTPGTQGMYTSCKVNCGAPYGERLLRLCGIKPWGHLSFNARGFRNSTCGRFPVLVLYKVIYAFWSCCIANSHQIKHHAGKNTG